MFSAFFKIKKNVFIYKAYRNLSIYVNLVLMRDQKNGTDSEWEAMRDNFIFSQTQLKYLYPHKFVMLIVIYPTF